MSIMTALMIAIAKEDTTESFYRFGPHPDLSILGYTIDTSSKYILVVCYALTNTVVRNLNHNVISPWITFNITGCSTTVAKHAYEISIASTLYSWFDWLIYIHMLMAQIDMVIIEMGADVIATCVITRWYLEQGGPHKEGYASIGLRR